MRKKQTRRKQREETQNISARVDAVGPTPAPLSRLGSPPPPRPPCSGRRRRPAHTLGYTLWTPRSTLRTRPPSSGRRRRPGQVTRLALPDPNVLTGRPSPALADSVDPRAWAGRRRRAEHGGRGDGGERRLGARFGRGNPSACSGPAERAESLGPVDSVDPIWGVGSTASTGGPQRVSEGMGRPTVSTRARWAGNGIPHRITSCSP